MRSVRLGLGLVCSITSFACALSAPSGSTNVSNPSSPGNTNTQGKNGSLSREQTRFGAEEKINRPVNVPDDVLHILSEDRQNQRRLGEGQSLQAVAASFTAGEINLNDDDLPDLIVQAVDPRLLGANLVPFWVFRKVPQGYKLVLRVDALGLELLKTKTNDYRDLLASQATAREVQRTSFEFDGGKYRERHSSREQIKP